jgi:hypothetical protein
MAVAQSENLPDLILLGSSCFLPLRVCPQALHILFIFLLGKLRSLRICLPEKDITPCIEFDSHSNIWGLAALSRVGELRFAFSLRGSRAVQRCCNRVEICCSRSSTASVVLCTLYRAFGLERSLQSRHACTVVVPMSSLSHLRYPSAQVSFEIFVGDLHL